MKLIEDHFVSLVQGAGKMRDGFASEVGRRARLRREVLRRSTMFIVLRFLMSSALRRSAMWCALNLHTAPDGAE